jgi:pimeloyl-ACP methyl ester carboxylesterase
MRRALLLSAVVALLAAAPARADLPWSGCADIGFEAFQCSSLAVPLDRSGQVPGQVALFVRRIKPLDAPSAPTPTAVVALAGGPGQAAAPLAGSFAIALAPALQSRDLLVFDQRGTGRSDPLRCAESGTAAQCAAALGPRRAFFRTTDSVEDIEALRAAAGYEKLTLFGVSYGTKVALNYASRYPERVERLVLDSVVPPDGQDGLLRSSVAASGRVLRELCSGSRCRRATPSVISDVRRLARRSVAARGVYVDARGRRRRAALRGSDLFPILQAGDLNPGLRAQLPAALRSAVRRDPAPLLRLALAALGPPGAQEPSEGANPAVFLATSCEEARLPWDRTASPEQRSEQAASALLALPDASFSPFTRLTVASSGLLRLCRGWPNATPAPVAPGPLPDVPVLVLSGRADVRTPTEDARRLASAFPQASVVDVPFVGHSVLGGDPTGCAGAALAGFFADRGVTPCGSGRPLVAPVAIVPRSVASLGRTGGVAGRRGRTLTAILRTADDALLQVATAEFAGGATRLGGLRRGVIIRTSSSVLLRSVEFVPGVRVSGTLPRSGAARLTVSGRAAARGRVRITRTRLTGTLGGRRVRLRRRGTARAASLERLRPRDLMPLPALVRG